jgi:hypothetical protein
LTLDEAVDSAVHKLNNLMDALVPVSFGDREGLQVSIDPNHLYGISDSSDFSEAYACIKFEEYGVVQYHISKRGSVWTKLKEGKCLAHQMYLFIDFDDDTSHIFASPVSEGSVWHSSAEDSYRHLVKDPLPLPERMMYTMCQDGE